MSKDHPLEEFSVVQANGAHIKTMAETIQQCATSL
jgi:hypothetical protein